MTLPCGNLDLPYVANLLRMYPWTFIGKFVVVVFLSLLFYLLFSSYLSGCDAKIIESKCNLLVSFITAPNNNKGFTLVGKKKLPCIPTIAISQIICDVRVAKATKPNNKAPDKHRQKLHIFVLWRRGELLRASQKITQAFADPVQDGGDKAH